MGWMCWGGALHRKTLGIKSLTFLLEGDIANHSSTVSTSNALWTANISMLPSMMSGDSFLETRSRPSSVFLMEATDSILTWSLYLRMAEHLEGIDTFLRRTFRMHVGQQNSRASRFQGDYVTFGKTAPDGLQSAL